MLTAIYTIIIFCLIIAIHEFGHFIMAKLTGVTVHEFSIGMGPKLFGFRKGGTDYKFSLLPIGGYVKLEGEDSESDDPNAFGNKKPWQRLLVLAAGALMNFVLGFVLFVIWCSFSKGFTTNIVDNIVEKSAFEEAGIRSGDVIVRMEGNNCKTNVHDYYDIYYFSYKNGTNTAKITFNRDGKKFEKVITPKYAESAKRAIFGFSTAIQKPNPVTVVSAAYRQSIFVVKIVVSSFADLIKGTVHMSDMSGPVGIVNEIGSAAKQGILDVIYLAGLISINLGVVNLFPLPALDGGRIIFVIIEVIRRKPVDRNKEGLVHLIGFALLILLMIFITYADIMKLV